MTRFEFQRSFVLRVGINGGAERKAVDSTNCMNWKYCTILAVVLSSICAIFADQAPAQNSREIRAKVELSELIVRRFLRNSDEKEFFILKKNLPSGARFADTSRPNSPKVVILEEMAPGKDVYSFISISVQKRRARVILERRWVGPTGEEVSYTQYEYECKRRSSTWKCGLRWLGRSES